MLQVLGQQATHEHIARNRRRLRKTGPGLELPLSTPITGIAPVLLLLLATFGIIFLWAALFGMAPSHWV